MTLNRFAQYTWFIIAYNLFIIVWGAFVRATGSGAGCGAHWPTCHGEVIPRTPEMETMIEFFHRATSGLALPLMIGLVIWAYRTYPKGGFIRMGAVWSLIFVIIEALIGAGLVLFELVAENTSHARLYVMVAHLVSTFFLLGILTLTAWQASSERNLTWRNYSWVERSLISSVLFGTLFVGATGAIIALGDTLFPAETLAQGLQQKADPNAHIAVRLRNLHPSVAVLVAVLVAYTALYFNRSTYQQTTRRLAQFVLIVFIIQLMLGSLNVFLLAPVWMQLIHLLVSDLIWIGLILLSASVFSDKSCSLVQTY